MLFVGGLNVALDEPGGHGQSAVAMAPGISARGSADQSNEAHVGVAHGNSVAIINLNFPMPMGGPEPDPIAEAHDVYTEARDELLKVQLQQGSAAALEELDVRSRANVELGGVCHAISHDLGHQALQLAGGKPGKALTVRNDVCGGGFTHGVIEEALATSKNPDRDLLRICAPEQDGSCFHGVGHGVMFATGLDVAKSLDLCDLAPRSILSVRCGEGVFMQLFSADVAGGHAAGKGTNPETVDTASGTCARIRMPYAGSCWFYTPTLWLADRPDDFTGAIGWCADAPSTFGQQQCAKGVGSRTIKYHPDDPTIGASICGQSGDLMDSCLAGMGSYWSVHFKGQRLPSDVCGRLGDARLESRCLKVT